MSRAELLKQLEQANARVAEGEEQIARQKTLIHELNRDGPSGTNAAEYLRFLELMQDVYVAHRDLLEFELRNAKPEK